MKNAQLYRTIEDLIENKKNSVAPDKPSFAHEYCKAQIQKKKLIPFDPKSKMNRLMKNFQRIDTYVNMEDLFEHINMLITQKQRGDFKSHQNITFRSKNNIVSNDEYQIIFKARELIGPYNQKIYMKENEEIWNLISDLQSESNVGSYRKKNSPAQDDISICIKNLMENEPENQKFQNQKQPWRFYQGKNYIFEDLTVQKKQKGLHKLPQIDRLALQSSIKKRQQRTQLIHQVATYLQIILQNHHKKKWGQRKRTQNQENQQNIEQASQKIKKRTVKINTANNTLHESNLFRQGGSSVKQSLNSSPLKFKKQSSHLSNFSNMSSKRQTTNNSFIIKKGVKQNFTFRNRNIKQGLMKKLDSFLDFVETEEKQLKKQKCVTLNELNFLQNKSKIQYERYCQKGFAVDDHEIKKIQNIVHLQK